MQSAGKIQDRGQRITLKVTKKEVKISIHLQNACRYAEWTFLQDLDRQIIKSSSAIFAIPVLEFEQEPQRDKGG